MTDGQFDRRIREILSEPGEQLSPEALDELWAGVESRLDGAAGRRRAVVLRRWIAAVSAAAAVALAFCLVHFLPGGASEGAGPVAENFAVELDGRALNVEPAVGAEQTGKEAPCVKGVLAAVASERFPGNAGLSSDGGRGAVGENDAVGGAADVDSAVDLDNVETDSGTAVQKIEEAEDADGSGLVRAETERRGVARADEKESEDGLDVDNSDIEKAYGKENGKKRSRKRTPFELSVGGNSFVGPQKSSGPVRLSSKGNRTPSGKEFVEGSNSDTYSLPISFGVGVKYGITKWLGVGIGVSYTLLNKKVSGTYYDADGWCCSADMKNSQHYIGIPLDIYFTMFRSKRWSAYATVGGAVEKCVRNRYTGTFDGEPLFYTRKVDGVQTSVKAGLGIEYSPLDFLGIYIDPSVRYYFAASQPRSIRTAQPLAFGVEAGLRFKL